MSDGAIWIIWTIFSVYIFTAIALAIIPLIIKGRERSKFLKANPDYVTMRIFSESSSSQYLIKIYSVNDRKPMISPGEDMLYLAPGKNKIIAKFKTQTEDQKLMPWVAAFISGIIGVIIYTIYLVKISDNAKSLAPVNGIVIELDVKANSRYEMKADPYTESINVIHLQGEKHDIKSYTLKRPEAY